jgi:hypothetical protein
LRGEEELCCRNSRGKVADFSSCPSKEMSGRADPEEVEVSLCPVGDVSAVPQGYAHDGVEENDEKGRGTNRQPEVEGEGMGTDRLRSFGVDASMSSVQASTQNEDGAGVVEAEAIAEGPGRDESVASAVGNCEGEERSADDGHPQFLRLASKSGGVEVIQLLKMEQQLFVTHSIQHSKRVHLRQKHDTVTARCAKSLR